MFVSKCRLTGSCAAVVRDGNAYRFVSLPAGSVVFTNSSAPDAGGMIEGICGEQAVRLFASDLERAERTEIRQPPATVRQTVA
jgi:hypothetical protein